MNKEDIIKLLNHIINNSNNCDGIVECYYIPISQMIDPISENDIDERWPTVIRKNIKHTFFSNGYSSEKIFKELYKICKFLGITKLHYNCGYKIFVIKEHITKLKYYKLLQSK